MRSPTLMSLNRSSAMPHSMPTLTSLGTDRSLAPSNANTQAELQVAVLEDTVTGAV